MRPVLEILNMAGYFLDRPRKMASLELPATYMEKMSTRASLSIPTPQKAGYGPILTFNVNSVVKTLSRNVFTYY
jgi:hypothetical protein